MPLTALPPPPPRVRSTKVGTVQILPDVLPVGPFSFSRPRSMWRQQLPGDGCLERVSDPRGRRRRLAATEAASVGWPGWLYQLYDVERVAERAHLDAQRCMLCSPEAVPKEPVKLSYWVAMNLPIDDKLRWAGSECEGPRCTECAGERSIWL